MPTREFTVTNKLGIHARPAAQFVKTASTFSCDVQVEKDDEQADGGELIARNFEE
jgi:phosphocarrier protein